MSWRSLGEGERWLPLLGAQAQEHGHRLALWGSASTVANRVSYFYDFHGPSMAVDTMCSSSLTAIHLACEAIKSGQCEAAIAGGVNISPHPNKFMVLSQRRFLSSDGRCRSFGEGGDGYVPGEGVGAVLLKPLARAVADGDHIYGVIKGTAFRGYFERGFRLAVTGDQRSRVDYLVHCGPSMGAFNQVVAGTALHPWRARTVEAIADVLTEGAAAHITARLRRFG